MNDMHAAVSLRRWNRMFLLAVMLWLLTSIFGWISPWRGELLIDHFIAPMLLALSGIWLFARGREMRWEQGLLIGLTVWYALTRAINGPHYLDADYETLCRMAGIAMVVFPFASLFDVNNRKKIFTILAATVVTLMGKLAWMAVVIVTLRQNGQPCWSVAVIGFHKVYNNRLNLLNLNPNFSAGVFTFAIGLTLALCTSIQRKRWRILLGLLGLGLYAGIALTRSRTALVVTSLELGMFAFLALRKAIPSRSGFLKGLAVLLVGAVMIVMPIFALYASADWITMATHGQGAHQVQAFSQTPGAAAQGPGEMPPTQGIPTQEGLAGHLRLQSLYTMSGRLSRIYPAAISVIKERPVTLLIGARTQEITPADHQLVGWQIGHWHSSFLQALMAAGLPALLLTLAFSALLVIKSAGLVLSSEAPLAAQTLVIAPVGLLLHSMLDHFLFLDTSLLNLLFMLFAGFVFAHGTGKRL